MTTPVSQSLLVGGGLICSGLVPYTSVLWYPDRSTSEVFMSLLKWISWRGIILIETGHLSFPIVDEETSRLRAAEPTSGAGGQQRSTDKGFWSWNSKDGIIGTLDWDQVRFVWLISAAFTRSCCRRSFCCGP